MMSQRDIVHLLSTLNDEQRQAIRLRCQFGMEDEEIAQHMSVSASAAKRYLALAYAKLRVDGFKKLRRFKVLLEVFWPVMRTTKLPPLRAEVDDLEEPPGYLLRRVDEDNDILKRLGWEELQALVEEIPLMPSSPPKPMRWFLIGVMLSGVALLGTFYVMSRLP